VLKYNEAAARVMKDEGVPTDDLYAFAKPKLAQIQNPKDVHYSKVGYEELAKQVVSTIEPLLPKAK
jgi:acyl-CoA thioesterase-1